MAPYFWTVVDKQSRSHSFTGAQHVVNMVLRALHDGIADISGSMRIAASVPAGGSGISPGPRASAFTWIRCGHWRSWAHFASRRVLSLRWSSYTFIEAHAGAQKSDAVNSFLASPSQRKFPGRFRASKSGSAGCDPSGRATCRIGACGDTGIGCRSTRTIDSGAWSRSTRRSSASC